MSFNSIIMCFFVTSFSCISLATFRLSHFFVRLLILWWIFLVHIIQNFLYSSFAVLAQLIFHSLSPCWHSIISKILFFHLIHFSYALALSSIYNILVLTYLSNTVTYEIPKFSLNFGYFCSCISYLCFSLFYFWFLFYLKNVQPVINLSYIPVSISWHFLLSLFITSEFQLFLLLVL